MAITNVSILPGHVCLVWVEDCVNTDSAVDTFISISHVSCVSCVLENRDAGLWDALVIVWVYVSRVGAYA